MLTAPQIAILQAALDTLALIGPKQVANPVHPPAALDTLAIRCEYRTAPKGGHYEAICDLSDLHTWAMGKTRAAALRNLFKALRNAASWNAPTLRVPLILCEPTKAKAEARNEKALRRAREWYADFDRAAKAMEAERAAPTIIAAAKPKFVEAPIIPADAASGSEGIFKALLGLRTEDKIVALVNALHAAGVTIHRVEEDGAPIIRASMPDYHPEYGTLTVLNL